MVRLTPAPDLRALAKNFEAEPGSVGELGDMWPWNSLFAFRRGDRDPAVHPRIRRTAPFPAMAIRCLVPEPLSVARTSPEVVHVRTPKCSPARPYRSLIVRAVDRRYSKISAAFLS